MLAITGCPEYKMAVVVGRAKERRTTIIRRPPADQTPGWPIFRLPPAPALHTPGQTSGCPRQCPTPATDDSNDRSVIIHYPLNTSELICSTSGKW